MEGIKADIGNWHIECLPEDGARISKLLYAGSSLLTQSSSEFKPPEKFYGEYENRPVFGYDDCFPTVDSCKFPGSEFESRDHGELCWLEWQAEVKGNTLVCHTECPEPQVSFSRIMEFDENRLTWQFEVINKSAERVPFLHVMHALLPLKKIRSVKLPQFGKITDEITSADLTLKTSDKLAEDLIDIRAGEYKMLLLKDLVSGRVKVDFNHDITLSIDFDIKLFPTIGIWWNNAGYPEEEGLQRTECAFEPIPGTCSDLSKSYSDGSYLIAEPGNSVSWEILWTIDSNR